MELSFIEWLKYLKREFVRKQNLLMEPNNPLYWSANYRETDFIWARPSCDNAYLAENNKLN